MPSGLNLKERPSGLNLKERQTDKPGAIKAAATNTALGSATAAGVVAVVTAVNPVFEEIFGTDVTTGQKIAFFIALIGAWALIASTDLVARGLAASADKLAIEKSAGELGKQLVKAAGARSMRVIEAPAGWKVEPKVPTPDLNGEFDVKWLRWAGDADEPEYQLVQNGTTTWVRESQLRRWSERAPGNGALAQLNLQLEEMRREIGALQRQMEELRGMGGPPPADKT